MQLIAHNIRSLYNIGAFFRSADAFGVEKIWLTGYTATPPREEITKVALGAEEQIPWERCEQVGALIDRLHAEGRRVIAFEVAEGAQPIASFAFHERDVLLFGNEPMGVPLELIAHCDACVVIPMRGRKTSLNVAVAVGVGLYAATSE
jgi:tRNA G18 (ribose-2'-O)-methylase SpoU